MFNATMDVFNYGNKFRTENVVAFAATQATGLLVRRKFKTAVAANNVPRSAFLVPEKINELGFKVYK